MPEYNDYTGQPAANKLSVEQKAWFAKKEEQIGIPIRVQFGNGQTISHPDNFDGVLVVDYGFPTANQEVYRDDHIWWDDHSDGENQVYNHRLSMNRYLLRGDTDHYPMQTPTKGYPPYGDLEYKSLWYRFVLRNITANGSRTLDEMMDVLVGFWIDLSLDKEFFEKQKEERFAKTRDGFISVAKVAMGTRIAQINQQITNCERDLANLTQQSVQVETRMRDNYRELDFAEQMTEKDAIAVGDQLDELLRGKKFDRVKWDNHNLHIFTKDLYLYSPDGLSRVPVGKFEITFSPRDREISIHNLTNMRGDRHHPHVPASGVPCWGAMEGPIRTLLRDMEILALFELILQFLESFNPDDSWGRWVANWWETQDKELKDTTTGEWKVPKKKSKAEAVSADQLTDEQVIEELIQ